MVYGEYKVLFSGHSLIDGNDLERILGLPVLVVLDEAYIEFANEPSRISWVPERSNLIVLRTFSKRAGNLKIVTFN